MGGKDALVSVNRVEGDGREERWVEQDRIKSEGKGYHLSLLPCQERRKNRGKRKQEDYKREERDWEVE